MSKSLQEPCESGRTEDAIAMAMVGCQGTPRALRVDPEARRILHGIPGRQSGSYKRS